MATELSRAEQASELEGQIKSSRLGRIADVGKFFYRTGLALATTYTLTQIDNGIGNTMEHMHGHNDAFYQP